jgi:Ca2+-binding RTX toxin-like protein
MADIYLSNFGDYWSNGFSINAVELANDGWTFFAGGSGAQQNQNLTVWAYKDGALQWQKDFGGTHNFESFQSLFYKDGYIYAGGAIGDGFAPSSLLGEIFPSDKPLSTLIEPEGNTNTAPVFVKLNALTGDLVYAKVLDSTVPGWDSVNAISVDDLGNMYVSKFGGSDDIYDGGITKIDVNGDEVWTMPSAGSIYMGADGYNYVLYGQDRIEKIASDGSILETYDPFPDVDYRVMGIYTAGFVVDSHGDLYVTWSINDKTKGDFDWTADIGVSTSKVVKVDGVTGEILWGKHIDPNGSSQPSSISIDHSGNVLVSGYTWTDFNGNYLSNTTWKDFYGATLTTRRDGYLITLNESNGEILDTTLIGAKDKISIINQAKIDTDGNIFIAGDFGAKYYSIENTTYQNIYLISPLGFTLMGNELENAIHGGDGNDSISAGLGADSLFGGKGNDTLNGGDGIDTADYSQIDTGVKIDLGGNKVTGLTSTSKLLVGTDKTSNIENALGGSGDDLLIASSKGSLLDGGDGNDTLKGGSKSDTLYGGDGNDIVSAGSGNDEIVGGDGAGDDTYDGGAGIDTVRYSSATSGITVDLTLTLANATSTLGSDLAGIGTDKLTNIENIIAGDYDDTLMGNKLNNRFEGGDGDDSLNGGLGNDTLIGGDGEDTFIFNTKLNKSSNVDTITDFSHTDDVIQLALSLFTNIKGGDNLFNASDLLVSSWTAKQKVNATSDAHLIFNTTNQGLYYDADGSGKGLAIQFATLTGLSSIDASDFTIN